MTADAHAASVPGSEAPLAKQPSAAPSAQLIFEMEFVRVQISLLPDYCPGCSLLLATDSALLTITRAAAPNGVVVAPGNGRTLSVSMDAVQAYAYAGAGARVPTSANNSAGGATAAAPTAAAAAVLCAPVPAAGQHTAPVSWLLASEGRLSPPADPCLHTVMTPFSCCIKHARCVALL